MVVDGIRITPEVLEYIKASGNYSFITLVNGKTLYSSINLGRLTKLFNLARVNRGISVNVQYIKSFEQGIVVMQSGYLTEPSRRRVTFVNKLIAHHAGKTKVA